MRKYKVTNWDRVETTLRHYYGSVDEGLGEFGISRSVKSGNHELSSFEVISLQEATDGKCRCEEM